MSLSKHLKPVKIAICSLTVSQWSDSSKVGGLSLSWQVFNLCSISAHRWALFAIHFFVDCPSSPSFVVFSLSYPPPKKKKNRDFFFSRHCYSFIMYCTITVALDSTHPTLTAPPSSHHLHLTSLKALNTLRLLPPPLLPTLLLPSPFTPQAWRSFLCSWHLFCWVINWDEHVGWRPVEGELRPPR